jgi:hypothetical protein
LLESCKTASVVLNIDRSPSVKLAKSSNLTVNTLATFGGNSVFAGNVKHNGSVCESKESVDVTLEANGGATEAFGVLTLTSASKENIFVTLKATASPTPNPVYDGTNIVNSIQFITLSIDFDLNSPPAENTVFTIHIVDCTPAGSTSTILPAVQTAALPLYFKGGVNLNTSSPIITHNSTNNVGLQSTATLKNYGNNVSFMYIKDNNNSDRLIVKSLIEAEIF